MTSLSGKIICCAGVFSVALFWRILCYFIQNQDLSRDAVQYLNLAAYWHENGGFGAVAAAYPFSQCPPFFLYLLQAGNHFGIPCEVWGIGINVAASSLLAVIFYLTARKLELGELPAFFIGLLAAVHPTLVTYSLQPQRESLYLLFLGCAILSCVYLIREGIPAYAAGVGLFAALGAEIRYEALEMLPLFILVLLWMKRFRTHSWTKVVVMGMLFAAGFLLVTGILAVSGIGFSDFGFWLSAIQKKITMLPQWIRISC